MNTFSRVTVGSISIAVAIAAYVGAVVYFERSYVDPRPAGRKVRLLSPPFERVTGEFVVRYGVPAEPGTVVYEDSEPLDEMTDPDGYRGPGMFQILPNGITFSPTDGSDPNGQKHRYWLVIK